MGVAREGSGEIDLYFEHTRVGVQLEEEGLKPFPFGEFLVDRRRLTRAQLFDALCAQDRAPGVRLGEVVAALGFVPYPEIDRLLAEFLSVPAIEVA